MSPLSGLVAAATPSPSPTAPAVDPDSVSPGLLGLISLIFLAVLVYLIWRGLNKQLRRIDFDDPAPPRRLVLPVASAPGGDAASEPSATAGSPDPPAPGAPPA